MEEHPVLFMETLALPSLLRVMSQLATVIKMGDDGSSSGILLPVVNATHAANTVISSCLNHLVAKHQGSRRARQSSEGGPIVVFTSLTYPVLSSPRS